MRNNKSSLSGLMLQNHAILLENAWNLSLIIIINLLNSRTAVENGKKL